MTRGHSVQGSEEGGYSLRGGGPDIGMVGEGVDAEGCWLALRVQGWRGCWLEQARMPS